MHKQFMPARNAGVLMRETCDHVQAATLPRDAIAVMNLLLFRVRVVGYDRCQVPLKAITRQLRIRKQTVVDIIRDLQALRLLTKVGGWVWVIWEGIRVKRRATNVYVFRPAPPEFRRGPALIETRSSPEEQRSAAAYAPARSEALEAALRSMCRSGAHLGFSMGD